MAKAGDACLLRLEGVRKTYRGSSTKAVDNLSLEVAPGEIFGFLGPNGAGKTTTIKMIVGLLIPDSGRIIVNGKDMVKDPVSAKKSIGFVPDNPNLYNRLTGLEYLNLVADIYRVSAAERIRRTSELLSMFDLTSAAGDIIESYSHGMKQKLALTGALLHNPPLFILDEPMVGLDPRSSKLFKDLMRNHCDQGYAVFFSTHILEVAERLCDRVGIIDKGKLIACGSMDELRTLSNEAEESLETIFLELTEPEEAV
ncbi:MAG TPA: ABC transporter ATP-binding protein [Bacillota bacterium]|nr:ABC transporter ATP-binding protein [Bacillota bacterium]